MGADGAVSGVDRRRVDRGVGAGDTGSEADLIEELCQRGGGREQPLQLTGQFPACGGGGGGRPNFAQAGGRDASKLPEALETAKAQLKETLES